MSQRALTDLQQQSFLTQAKLSKKFKKKPQCRKGNMEETSEEEIQREIPLLCNRW